MLVKCLSTLRILDLCSSNKMAINESAKNCQQAFERYMRVACIRTAQESARNQLKTAHLSCGGRFFPQFGSFRQIWRRIFIYIFFLKSLKVLSSS